MQNNTKHNMDLDDFTNTYIDVLLIDLVTEYLPFSIIINETLFNHFFKYENAMCS